jgi:hypothetical protein
LLFDFSNFYKKNKYIKALNQIDYNKYFDYQGLFNKLDKFKYFNSYYYNSNHILLFKELNNSEVDVNNKIIENFYDKEFFDIMNFLKKNNKTDKEIIIPNKS